MGSFRPIGHQVFSSAPAVVAWGQNDTFLFAFAVGTDQALWYSQLDGQVSEGATWGPWRSLGGVVMSAPTAVRSGESSVDVFALGAHSDLLHWQFTNGAWRQWPIVATNEATPTATHVVPPPPPFPYWESLGGILTSPPHAISLGDISPFSVAFGLGTDHAVWFKASGRTWDTLGFNPKLASPAYPVARDGVDFFVFGLGVDSAIWVTDNSGSWNSLGGTYSSEPYVVSTPEHVHLFAADTQKRLSHRRWDGNSWSSWESLGGTLVSQPTANNFGDLVHVYVIGTDSATWRRRFLGSSWTDWDSLGGTFISPPAGVARAQDVHPTRDLLALGADHQVWHMEDEDS